MTEHDTSHTPGPWKRSMLGGGKGKPNEYSIRVDCEDSSALESLYAEHVDKGYSDADSEGMLEIEKLIVRARGKSLPEGAELVTK